MNDTDISDIIGKVGTYSGDDVLGDKGGTMRATTVTLSLVSLLLTGAFSFSLAQAPQPVPTPPATAQPVPWHPCAKITAACSQAGFVPNGAKTGVGIAVDCIRPIIVGMPQRNRATKPLPPLDPQVVQACKQRNPSFGMEGGPIVAFSLKTR